MSEPSKDTTATDGKAHKIANDSLRETAKWIVAGVFACVSVVLGGTSFSSIGDLFGEEVRTLRVFCAIVGGGIGVFGLVRLLFDAMSVLTFQQFSLPQYAYGTLSQADSTSRYDPAAMGPVAFPDDFFDRSQRFWRARRSFNIEMTQDIRTHIDRQFAPFWPEGIESFEQFAKVSLLAEREKKNAEEISGASVSFFIDNGKLIARGGGQTLKAIGSEPFLLTQKDKSTIEVSGKAKTLTFKWDNGKNVPVADPQGHSISHEDIEWFGRATYNAAIFNKVSFTFDGMQRRLPSNVLMILVGFVTMIAAINPPAPQPEEAPPPTEITTVEIEYNEGGNEVRRTTTTTQMKGGNEQKQVDEE